MTDQLLAEARGLVVRRGGRILNRLPISFRINEGGLVVARGPNGCGKSTLCEVMSGRLAPAAGVVERRVGRRWVFFSPQSIRLFPALRVDEVLAAVARTRNFHGQLARRAHLELCWRRDGVFGSRLDWALERFGLLGKGDRTCSVLSAGERQRLKLACACASGAKFLVLDEPLAGVDGSGRRALLSFVAERRAAGAGFLIVAHEPLQGIEGAEELLWQSLQ